MSTKAVLQGKIEVIHKYSVTQTVWTLLFGFIYVESNSFSKCLIKFNP